MIAVRTFLLATALLATTTGCSTADLVTKEYFIDQVKYHLNVGGQKSATKAYQTCMENEDKTEQECARE